MRTNNYRSHCTVIYFVHVKLQLLPSTTLVSIYTLPNTMDNTRTLDFTRLVVILLWAALATIQIQRLSADHVPCGSTDECRVSNSADLCGCNQYNNSGNNSCEDCVKCCEQGQVEIEPCAEDSNAVCSQCTVGEQFFNLDTFECENCVTCKTDEQMITECSIHENTKCRPRCQPHQYYIEDENKCQFKCELCQFSCVTTGTPRCKCQPAECYADTDILCEHNICTTTQVSTVEVTSTVDNESNELPTWGIGLISIGVVIGIVAFSAGSMILSFCTRKTNRPDDDEEQQIRDQERDSKPVLMGRYINGQPSPFLYPNHYKHHHHHSSDSHRKYGHLSNTSRTNSLRNSPKALRVVPSPRTDNATPI